MHSDTAALFSDLFTSGVPIVEKFLRTVVVYFFLIGLLRIAGKRTLGSFNAFDLVVLLLLSNTVQNAIIGNDNSLIGGLVGAAALIAVNYVVVWYLYHHRRAEQFLEGRSTILMRHGKYVDENLSRQLITHGELLAAARRQGIQKVSDIACARLETGGSVTFEVSTPTEQERHLSDIVQRLERVESHLEQLVAHTVSRPAEEHDVPAHPLSQPDTAGHMPAPTTPGAADA